MPRVISAGTNPDLPRVVALPISIRTGFSYSLLIIVSWVFTSVIFNARSLFSDCAWRLADKVGWRVRLWRVRIFLRLSF
jgi:hypothetical protein